VSYTPGEDAEELRTVVRGFLAKRSPESEVRRLMDSEDDFDADVWHIAATELGLNGIAIPEQYGGSGAGMVELGVVLEETGRALLCAPLFATVGLASWMLLESADPQAKNAYLPVIAAGDIRSTVGWGGQHPLGSTVRATTSGAAWTLSGRADNVISGSVADLLLIIAATADGPALFAVDAESGVSRTPLTVLDPTRPLANIDFHETPAHRIESDPDGLQRGIDRGTLLLAAEQLGGAAFALEMSVMYAKERVQFGRRIGSFQVIKHRCADLLVDVESARSVVWHGLWSVDQDTNQLAVAASLARSICSETYVRVASENIQIHGGIGFTWEHPAHLYLKRAKSSQLLLGSSTYHRARLADLLAIPKAG
jgi:alkylation response protein AidB-like acyl-CoA dehydrogenase